MKIALIVLAILLIVFVGPPIVIFYIVFKRAPMEKLRGLSSDSEHYRKYQDKFGDAISFIDNLDSREVEIESYDGLRLRGIYYDGGYAKTAIFMHGYHTKPKDSFYVAAKDLYEHGYNLLFPYERAHGLSEGKYLCLGLKEQYDVLDWIGFLEDKTKEIIIYGMSMGSGAVGFASSKIRSKKVKTLIIDCGFYSPYQQMKDDATKRHIPWFLVVPWEVLYAKLLIGINVKTKVSDSLRENSIPTFFLHGGRDKSVDVSHGEYNYRENKSAKELFIVEEAGHTQSYVERHNEAKEKLMSFIDRYSEV